MKRIVEVYLCSKRYLKQFKKHFRNAVLPLCLIPFFVIPSMLWSYKAPRKDILEKLKSSYENSTVNIFLRFA